MPKIGKHKSARRGQPVNRAGGVEDVAKFSRLDIQTGSLNWTQLSPQDLFDREEPKNVQAACKQARLSHEGNWFVETIILLIAAFYNYGMRLVPAAATGPAKKRAAAGIKEWLSSDQNAEGIERYIGSVWNEWLIEDNVVSFWRKEARVQPYLLPAEQCKYSDALGLRKMIVELGLKKEQLEKNGQPVFPKAQMDRYLKNEIELDEKYDEYYEVLTRAARGSGMGKPRLARVFRALSQCESMEVGESMYAYAGRLVLRFHRMGFEVKAGTNAMKQGDFLWKKKRADAIEKFFRGAAGFAETTGQFDHKIDYVWTDPKLYDAKKWGTVVDRLLWWAGPVGFMMLAKSVSPFLMRMLKTAAEADRRKVGLHLSKVINAGFDIGVPVKLAWSNRCFYDERLAWDMVKSLVQQGPLSLRTGLEEADFDPEQEADRKKLEADTKRDDELLPKFDPNHGNRPGSGAGLASNNPGRKAGVPDHSAIK